MKRGDNSIVGIDLETGGFEPGRNSILAIGAYWRPTESFKAGGGEPMRGRRLRLLVEREPDTVVEREAAAKNGWESDEQWLALGAVPLVSALDFFVVWLRLLAGEIGRNEGTAGAVRSPLPKFEPLSHNHAAVDRPFLEYWAKRYDLGEVFFGEEGLLSHAWHDSMTTLRAAQVAGLVPAGGASLDAMLEMMGRRRQGMGKTSNIEQSTSNAERGAVVHDAAEDARACFEGYHWLVEIMKRGGRP